MKRINKFFAFGSILLVVNLIICLVLRDIKLLPILTGITSAPFVFLSALMVGTFIGTDSQRADIYTESRDSFKRRTTWSTNFLLIGLPCFIVYILSFVGMYYLNDY